MKVTFEQLVAASKKDVISLEQAKNLWSFLNNATSDQSPSFKLGHIIYYFGGLIVIGAMSWFMVTAWEVLGGSGIAIMSSFFAVSFFLLGRMLWKKKEYRIPAGILITAAVSMTPLIVYGIQKALGFWPGNTPSSYQNYHTYIKRSWLVMELATVIVGCLVIRFYRYPFITFPICYALWYLSMDIVPYLFNDSYFYSSEAKKLISIVFGSVMIFATYFIDRRTKEDFSFWGYLYGALIFWGGLSLMKSDSEIGKFIYALTNLGLIFLSVFLSRRIFIILGSCGIFFYLGHLSRDLFKDSLMFPIILALFGLLIIYLGVLYQKNEKQFEEWITNSLPDSIKALRPTERN